MEEFFGRLNEFHKKYSRFFLMGLLIVAVILCMRALPFVARLLLPFIIGYIISLIAAPMVGFLKKKLHIPYKVGAIVAVLLLLSLLSLLVMFLVSGISDISGFISENWRDILNGMTNYVNSVYEGLVNWSNSLPFDFMEALETNLGGGLNPSAGIEPAAKDLEKMGEDFMTQLTSWLLPYAGNVATGTISVVKSLPEAIIFMIMLIFSTYLFTSSRENFKKWYEKTWSQQFRDKMHVIKIECFGAMVGALRAQVILTLITAVELFVGFLIMGIEGAPLLAVLIAIVDMLPILGVGTVLIPWAIINLLAGGSVYITIGMIVLYLICLVVRNIIQPRIMGEFIGIGPITSLVSIWVGYKLYGFLGMLIVPVIVTLIYKFYEVGLFDWFFLSHKKEREEKAKGVKG